MLLYNIFIFISFLFCFTASCFCYSKPLAFLNFSFSFFFLKEGFKFGYCGVGETALCVLIFACIYFHELKKPYFASTYFREWQVFENFTSTYFFEWEVFENFEFINFSPKKKEKEKNSWVSCFRQDQRKDR